MPTPKKEKTPLTLGDIAKRLSTLRANQVLYSVLLVAVFLLGYLICRVQMLESNSAPVGATGQQAQKPAITDKDIKQWAKEVGLNTGNFNSCYDSKPHQAKIDQDQADAQAVEVSGTPTFFINGVKLVGALPFAQFKDAIDAEIAGTQTAARSTVDVGHLPMLGKDSATVTVVEFSDLECPFCNNFFKQTFPQIKKDYIDTGKIKFYFRHYPLSFHPLAQPFANAVECANEQGKFWELHDKIYNEQS